MTYGAFNPAPPGYKSPVKGKKPAPCEGCGKPKASCSCKGKKK